MTYCINCMNIIEDDKSMCPLCGSSQSIADKNLRALPPLTILNGKYITGKVIGEGGFGITYLGLDLNLNSKVAIKEYCPAEFVSRDSSVGVDNSVYVNTKKDEERFNKGLERFVDEASNLAKFKDLPGIVSVKDFFYENKTAYMVMEYIDGNTLTQYLKEHGNKIYYEQAIEMLKPVMESLYIVHKSGIIHRDISPDNIMTTKDNRVKLIDFGAAHFVKNEDAKSLTIVLKHGYAPPEQYQTDGNQGPWTDVYALAATMFRMITGMAPQNATDRMINKENTFVSSYFDKSIPKSFIKALENGMNVSVTKRTQSIDLFCKELCGNNGKRNKMVVSIISGMLLGISLFCIYCIFNGNVKRHDTDKSLDEDVIVSENDSYIVSKDESEQHEKANTVDDSDIKEVEKQALEEDHDSLEMMAYKAYFEKMYVSDGRYYDYYIYFCDIEHRGNDDMIVVTPIYEDDTEESKLDYYVISVFSDEYNDIKKIYETNVYQNNFYFGNELYLLYEEDNAFFVRQTTQKIDPDRFKDKMEGYSYDCYSEEPVYKKYYVDGQNEIVIEDSIKYYDEYLINPVYTAYDVLPEGIQKAFRITGTNNEIMNDENPLGGINVSYNHNWKNVIKADGCSKTKEHDEYALKHYYENEGYLTDMIFVDLDGDRSEEVIKTYIYNYQEAIDSYNDIFERIRPEYKTYIYDENRNNSVCVDSLKENVYCIAVAQFGKQAALLLGWPSRCEGIEWGGTHRNLLTKYNDQIIQLFDFEEDNLTRVDNYTYEDKLGIKYGRYGDGEVFSSEIDLCFNREGEVYIKTYGTDDEMYLPYPEIKYHIGFVDGQFIEYDSIVVDEDYIERFVNSRDELKTAQDYIYSNHKWDLISKVFTMDIDYEGDTYDSFRYTLNTDNIMLSSNDKLYINYEFVTEWDADTKSELFGWDYAEYYGEEDDDISEKRAAIHIAAVFNISNNEIRFVGTELGGHALSSGLGFKSVTPHN